MMKLFYERHHVPRRPTPVSIKRSIRWETAAIVPGNDETAARTDAAQVRMMGEIAKLTAGSDGSLDEADDQRTVDTLLAGGSDPVISMEPEGAWTSVIPDQALN